MSLDWHGEEAERLLVQCQKEALWQVGQDAISGAMMSVPIDTGTLRRSAVVSVGQLPNPSAVYDRAKVGEVEGSRLLSSTAKDVTVFVSYNTPYAIRLHEDLTWKPRKFSYTAQGNMVTKPRLGKPKWLEKQMPASWAKLRGFLAREMRKSGF